MKKALRNVLLVLSYIWVMVIDIILMLSMYSMIDRVLLSFGFTDTTAYLVGFATTLLVLIHLRFRHRIREFQRPPVIQIKDCCDCQCGCNDQNTESTTQSVT